MAFFPLGGVVLAVAQVIVGHGVLALFGDFAPGVVVAVFLGLCCTHVASPPIDAESEVNFTGNDDGLVRSAESLHLTVVHGL